MPGFSPTGVNLIRLESNCRFMRNWYNARLVWLAGISDQKSEMQCLASYAKQVSINASVVKLVDTPDSKSGSFTGVAVQVRPLVPNSSPSQAIPFGETS